MNSGFNFWEPSAQLRFC